MGYEKSHSIPIDFTSYHPILRVRRFVRRTTHSQERRIPMEDHEEVVSTRLDQPPAPRRRGRRWLLIGALAFAFMLALGVGVLRGSLTSAAQAAALTTGSTSSSQSLAFAQGPARSGQGMQGQCESLTVSSVNGNTI